MVSYTAQVNTIHKKFNVAVRKAKTKQALNKAYSSHKKEHERILKKHLQEEMAMIKKAKTAIENSSYPGPIWRAKKSSSKKKTTSKARTTRRR